MNQNTAFDLLVWWLVLASLWAFLLFGIDKWRAKQDSKRRISELSLLLVSALGGWPGGLIGLVFFRHKSAKLSFLLKFVAAFIVCFFLVGNGLRLAGRL